LGDVLLPDVADFFAVCFAVEDFLGFDRVAEEDEEVEASVAD
jgi:hypothetical protein